MTFGGKWPNLDDFSKNDRLVFTNQWNCMLSTVIRIEECSKMGFHGLLSNSGIERSKLEDHRDAELSNEGLVVING